MGMNSRGILIIIICKKTSEDEYWTVIEGSKKLTLRIDK
jgi:hypothetical protein